MSRAVTADHVLFDECIRTFRRRKLEDGGHKNATTVSYLLTSFVLSEPWVLPDCIIHPSTHVPLPGPYAAYISRVDNPPWVDDHNPQLYGLALAAVLSFTTERPCKSTRDGYRSREPLAPAHLTEMPLTHPVLMAGPGCMYPHLTTESRTNLSKGTEPLVAVLGEAVDKEYLALMQAIRLVHLSLLNKRDDFGVAYLLLVSAIESVAQLAVTRNDVRQTHPAEGHWESEATENPTVKEVLREYRNQRGKNRYLKERYVRFIKQFAPPGTWHEVVAHPLQDVADMIQETQPGHDVQYLTQTAWFETYPNDLPSEAVDAILSDSYRHRSSFIHRGQQPPHREPTGYNRFFQEIHSFDNHGYTVKLLPNYELLLGIAQRAISGWATRET